MEKHPESLQYVPDWRGHKDCSRELKPGEMWVGNTDVRAGLTVPPHLIGKLKTARLGEQAYALDGTPLARSYMRPLIIAKAEEPAYDRIYAERMKAARR